MPSPKKKVRKVATAKNATFLSRFFESWRSHPIIVTTFLLIFSLAAGIGVYIPVTDYFDTRTAQEYKQQLDAVDIKMNVEFNQIIAELGEPDAKSNEKICSYVSADLDPGPPRCGAVYYVQYNFMAKEDAEKFLGNVKQAVQSAISINLKDAYVSESADGNELYAHIYTTKDISNRIRCTVDINAEQSDQHNSRYKVETTYSCKKLTPKPIYREVNK